MKTTDFKSKLKPIITIAVFILLIITIIVQYTSILSLKEKFSTLDAQSIFLGDQFINEKRATTWDIKLIFACYNDKAITFEYLQSLEF